MAVVAKQTKEVTPAAAATPGAAKTTVDVGRDANDRFTIVMDPADKTKVKDAGKQPPQAQVIINAIATFGHKGCTRAELLTALGDGVNGPLKTKQGAGRIVSYYQKRIVGSGAVVLAKSAPVAPVAVAA